MYMEGIDGDQGKSAAARDGDRGAGDGHGRVRRRRRGPRDGQYGTGARGALSSGAPTCWWQATSPASHFTRSTICSRLTKDGRVSISGRTLITTEAGERTERQLPDDAAVLAAYREHFGIALDQAPRDLFPPQASGFPAAESQAAGPAAAGFPAAGFPAPGFPAPGGVATAGMVVFGGSFVGLMLLPVNFPYWAFAVLIAANGIGSGLFAAPNSSSIMGSVPARQRGAASGMRSTFQNSGTALSIGVAEALARPAGADPSPGQETA